MTNLAIIHDFDLTGFNTLQIPARTAAFTDVYHGAQTLAAIEFARDHKLPILVLGQGSNIVFAEDWPGLIIHQCSTGWRTVLEDDERVVLRVAAGENWHQFVRECINRGFYGLENLALIPGTVGAAPIQNIGAYGIELSAFVQDVGFIDVRDLKQYRINSEACEFRYRDSIFKADLKDHAVITDVTLRLSKKRTVSLDYPALFDYFDELGTTAIDPMAVFNAVVDIRTKRLPDFKAYPNAGSFFKNPVLDRARVEKLLSIYTDMPVYDAGPDRFKVPAAWLIERCGWRGRTEEGLRMHERHALVLVNPDRAAGHAVLELARQVAESVYRQFDISLEIEPVVYP